MNHTSGGVTIVKLNSPTTIGNGIVNVKSVSVTNTQAATKLISPILNNGPELTISTSSTVPTVTSQITTTTGGGHTVTIHTSSIASATTGTTITATTACNSGSTATALNGNTVTHNPPHTGYTRRAKLGDSRSTGRLHSAGNTHRSMTRLNIAGNS